MFPAEELVSVRWCCCSYYGKKVDGMMMRYRLCHVSCCDACACRMMSRFLLWGMFFLISISCLAWRRLTSSWGFGNVSCTYCSAAAVACASFVSYSHLCGLLVPLVGVLAPGVVLHALCVFADVSICPRCRWRRHEADLPGPRRFDDSPRQLSRCHTARASRWVSRGDGVGGGATVTLCNQSCIQAGTCCKACCAALSVESWIDLHGCCSDPVHEYVHAILWVQLMFWACYIFAVHAELHVCRTLPLVQAHDATGAWWLGWDGH